MPDNIPAVDPYSKEAYVRPGYITTWLVKDLSSADDDEVAATKAAEAGKTHFVTFITASTDRKEPAIGSTEGGAIKIQLVDGAAVVWEAWVSDLTGNNPAHFAFPAPIQITEGNAVIVQSAMVGATDQVSVTFGGFTDDNRSD